MATTLRELAKRCGVRGGSIYYHFSSKEEILYQIMDYTMNSLLSNVKERVRHEKDPLTKLREAVRFHIEYHIESPNETFVADTEIRALSKRNYRRIVRKRKSYENIFIEILKESIENGIMGLENVKLSAIAILQMCTGVSYWFREDGPLTVNEIADAYVDFISWGVIGKANRQRVSHRKC